MILMMNKEKSIKIAIFLAIILGLGLGFLFIKIDSQRCSLKWKNSYLEYKYENSNYYIKTKDGWILDRYYKLEESK